MLTRLFPLLVCGALAACANNTGMNGMNASAGGSASQGSTESAAEQDMRLMKQMAQADIAEIAAGKLAADKGESAAVRRFGQRMVEDHSRLLKQGASFAVTHGMPVPTEADAKHQAAIQQLQSLSGAAFDRAYMQQMVKDHQQTLQLLEQAAAQARAPQLRTHAEQAIPHVRQHLVLAQRMSGDLVGSAR